MINQYQSLVHQNIPLTEYMEWSIQKLAPSDISTLTQLTPNINVHGTAFAGSIYAAAMATGWTLLKCWNDHANYETELVAAEADIKYFRPVISDFECSAQLNKTHESYSKLINRLNENRSCAIKLPVEVTCNSELCAILKITFVFKC
ncbi:MAG: thioesterase domain-containing protein [Kangiellaceae bacterium]|nr:thioesterase domain-containing protein [Kangiellaceae bacterium]MCW9000542.1 thioesterase domain-containing protein [Kangiellaceae bacterium]MCW9017923.1 thioesterase domain-containing protein [Kangiellaceae bacterium]